jgi:hypothetical protein
MSMRKTIDFETYRRHPRCSVSEALLSARPGKNVAALGFPMFFLIPECFSMSSPTEN